MGTNNIIPILLECCSFDAKNPCKLYIIIINGRQSNRVLVATYYIYIVKKNT